MRLRFPGCLEAFSSGSALTREANLRARSRRSTVLTKFVESGREIQPADIKEAARDGDPVAEEILETAGRYLGVSIANIINTLDPDLVVLSGGLQHLGGLYLNPCYQAIARHAFTSPQILVTQLGDNTGIFGAAAVAFDRLAA